MKLDSKLKGGLAWAGLVVVLAVPAANILLGQPVESTKVISTPEADTAAVSSNPAAAAKSDPVETASIKKDPVKAYLATGKKLPSYISGGGAESSVAPAASSTAGTAPAVSVPPAPSDSVATRTEVAPVPMPRSARPKPKDAVVASASASGSGSKATVSKPATDAPLVLDDEQVAAAQRAEPFPLSDGGNGSDESVVGSDDLEEWDSGSLADYLARKGLLSTSGEAQSTAANGTASDEPATSEGWFVDDGRDPPRRRRVEDSWFF